MKTIVIILLNMPNERGGEKGFFPRPRIQMQTFFRYIFRNLIGEDLFLGNFFQISEINELFL